jgi:peptide/nickel transport system permease protein
MLVGVTLASFVLAHVMPANPVAAFLGEQAAADPEIVAAFEHRWGLDKPLPEQYGIYLSKLVHGDMGTSLSTRQPVFLDLRQHLPATITLASCATVMSLIVGIPLGMVAAVSHGETLDAAARLLSVLGVSMPVFWLGLVAIFIFYVWLGWAPPPGQLSAQLAPPPFVTGFVIMDALLAGQLDVVADALKHLVLPATVLSFYGIGLITRMMRGNMLDVLREDYMRSARAKGLSGVAAVLRHAAPNALIPVITVIGLNFGNLMAGSVVIETVFAWPGLGQYAFQSAVSLDFPAIMGVGMVVAAVYLAINLVVDVVYAVTDPRVRLG